MTAATAPRPTRAVQEAAALTGRSLRHVLRSPDTIITTAITPVAMLLLFVYVLGGAIDVGGGDRGAYVDYLLPGILVVTVASSVSYTAYRLFTDVTGGIVERFRSLPISRSAVLWAHVLTSVLATFASLVLVLLIGLLMGFRSGAGPVTWLAVVGVLVLLVLALTWLAVLPGLTATSVDGVSGFSYPLVFLPFISSAFVPTDGMPGPVRWFAEHQPVTPVVDTLRGLLDQQPIGATGWIAVAWCTGLLLLARALAVRTYRRAVD